MSKRAKIIWVLATVFFTLLLLVIFTESRKADANSVGVVMSNVDNDYFGYMSLGITNISKSNGYNITVLNSNDKLYKSIKDVKNLTDRGFKVIIFNPVDSNQSTEAVNYAEKHGAKVISIDREVNGAKVLSHIDSNDIQGGIYAATYILTQLGKKARILELQGITGSSSTKYRTMAFADTIKGTGAKLVATYPADYDKEKAEAITYKVLNNNPSINAIFAQNDLMALGAADAAKTLKRDVVIVGYDGIPAVIRAIKKGTINATVQQQPIKMGTLAANVAMNYLQGLPTKLHSSHKVSVKLITKKNVEEAWGNDK